jgi:hypothetical protein
MGRNINKSVQLSTLKPYIKCFFIFNDPPMLLDPLKPATRENSVSLDDRSFLYNYSSPTFYLFFCVFIFYLPYSASLEWRLYFSSGWQDANHPPLNTYPLPFLNTKSSLMDD